MSGPDTGGRTVLPPGSAVLGRSTLAAVRADDPSLEPFHVDLRLPGHAGVAPSWVQLAGRRPVQGSAGPGHELLTVGAGRVRVRPLVAGPGDGDVEPAANAPRGSAPPGSASPGPARAEPATRVLVRSARSIPEPAPLLAPAAAHGVTRRHRWSSTRGSSQVTDDRMDDRADEFVSFDPGEPPDATSTLLPAVVTCAATVGLSVAIGQPMLMAMAALGALVAVCMWAATWVRFRRRRARGRRAAADRAARRAADSLLRRRALEHERRAAHAGIEGARRVLDGAHRSLWERRPWHGDAFDVVVGIGAVVTADLLAGTPVVSTADPFGRSGSDDPGPLVLDDVPITIDLGPGARVAVIGAFAESAARSVLVQIATTTGPADWALVVVSDRPQRWEWLRGLPHLVVADDGAVAHTDAAAAALVAAWTSVTSAGPEVWSPAPRASNGGTAPGGSTSAVPRHLVVVGDESAAAAMRTSAIRRLLHARPDAAFVGVFGARSHGRGEPSPELGVADERVPALCTTVVTTAADGTVRVAVPAGAGADGDAGRLSGAGHGRITGLGRDAATAAVACLTPWTDPEAPPDDGRSLPDDVDVDEVAERCGTPIERDALAARWRAAGPDAGVVVPIGAAADGVVALDLVADGPHGLVAGTTGSGKSELLRTIVVSACAAAPPDQLSLVLVDFKGGATFDGLEHLPHVAGVVTDLEPHLTERVLRSLRAEVTARERRLRELGAPDLAAARAAAGAPVVPRLLVIVDEFAALALDHPELMHSLVDVARRGRSLGVHLLLATQRPSGVVSEEIRANTALRIALRLHDPAEAVDVVGDAAPASFRRSSAGRAAMRLGPGELVTFQSARVCDTARTVAEIAGAAAELGLGRAPRPWCDPLPDKVGPTDVASVAAAGDAGGSARLDGGSPFVLGVVDLPDAQRRDVIGWRPADGHLLVVGSPGSGVTTTLASAAVRTLASSMSDPLGPPELVVVDATGDHRWDEVDDLARCAGVVRAPERERIERALRRSLATAPPAGRLVVIDGIGTLRRELEQIGRADAHERFETLMLATPPGVTLLLGAHGSAGLSPAVVSRCARRWVLHLHDPADGGAFGLRSSEVPPATAGRMVDVSTRQHAQLLGWPSADLARLATWADPADPADAADAAAHDGIVVSASAGAGPDSRRAGVGRVERIAELPTSVKAGDLPASTHDGDTWVPMIGLAHESLGPTALEVPAGEHLLVIGPPRSGRTGVLDRLRRCWSEARPDAAQVVLSPRRLGTSARTDALADALAQVHGEIAAARPVLLVVDDADLVDDTDGRLGALVATTPDGLTLVVACRPDLVRSHGHWAGALRRGRRGIVLSAASDLDADALGATLPRHPPLAPRPGLCWLIGDGAAVLVQAAAAT